MKLTLILQYLFIKIHITLNSFKILNYIMVRCLANSRVKTCATELYAISFYF